MSAYLDRSQPAKPDVMCKSGCGRKARRAGGLCYPCLTGRGVPQPDPRLLPDAYLARCLQEAARRAAEHRQGLAILSLGTYR